MAHDPNALLVTLLAAEADEETLAKAMLGVTFGLTGEVGSAGFGATTLDGYLVLFTHPEFYAVAGLPDGLQAIEATAQQAMEYARAVGLVGFVINPGTHQRFVALSLWQDFPRAVEPPAIPILEPFKDVPKEFVASVVAAAEASDVEAVWVAKDFLIAVRPHPDPAFLAGLLARDLRVPVYGTSLWWSPLYSREGETTSRAAFRKLADPLAEALVEDLVQEARKYGLRELWAFEAEFEGQPSVLALAYTPHPQDGFAAAFDQVHARQELGQTTVPLLSADAMREALPRIGIKLL